MFPPPPLDGKDWVVPTSIDHWEVEDCDTVVPLRVLNEIMDCPFSPCDDKETMDPWGELDQPNPKPLDELATSGFNMGGGGL